VRPSIATVLSPRPWEAELVRTAVESGLVRLLARCYNPADVPAVDAVVAGSEVPWLDGYVIAEWQRSGLAVIGVFPLGDRPAIEMFCRAGVDQLFADVANPVVMLRAIRDVAATETSRVEAPRPI
jgi:hypothetical protein